MKIKSSLLAGVSVLAACAWLSSGCASNETASSLTPRQRLRHQSRHRPRHRLPRRRKSRSNSSRRTARKPPAKTARARTPWTANPNTFWHTQWQDASPECPHEIIIELTPPSTIKGFTYLPRQDDNENGTIKDYEFYVSDDGKDFGQPVAKGTFETSKDKKTVTFDAEEVPVHQAQGAFRSQRRGVDLGGGNRRGAERLKRQSSFATVRRTAGAFFRGEHFCNFFENFTSQNGQSGLVRTQFRSCE